MTAGKVQSREARVENLTLKIYPKGCNTGTTYCVKRKRVSEDRGIMTKELENVCVVCELYSQKRGYNGTFWSTT